MLLILLGMLMVRLWVKFFGICIFICSVLRLIMLSSWVFLVMVVCLVMKSWLTWLFIGDFMLRLFIWCCRFFISSVWCLWVSFLVWILKLRLLLFMFRFVLVWCLVILVFCRVLLVVFILVLDIVFLVNVVVLCLSVWCVVWVLICVLLKVCCSLVCFFCVLI